MFLNFTMAIELIIYSLRLFLYITWTLCMKCVAGGGVFSEIGQLIDISAKEEDDHPAHILRSGATGPQHARSAASVIKSRPVKIKSSEE